MSTPVKSAISSNRRSIAARERPAARPPSRMFSRPERLPLKPTPSASSVETRPCTTMRPLLGGRMPATARMSVDLPAPLAPTTPRTAPGMTSTETSFRASTS